MRGYALLICCAALPIAWPATAANFATRPEIDWYHRWREDWSVLADPALRADPFDAMKYIPVGTDIDTYLSLGLTVRERWESIPICRALRSRKLLKICGTCPARYCWCPKVQDCWAKLIQSSRSARAGRWSSGNA